MRFSRGVQLALFFLAVWASPQGRGASVTGVAAEAPMVLPAFVVEETSGKTKWRYIGSPRFEILAGGSDQVAIQLAAQTHSGLQILDFLIPPRVRLRLNVPLMIVLTDSPKPRTSYWRNYADKDVSIVAVTVAGSSFPQRDFWVMSFLEDWLSRAAPCAADWLVRSVTDSLGHFSIDGTSLQMIVPTERPMVASAEQPHLMPLMALNEAIQVLSGTPSMGNFQSEDRRLATTTARLFVRWAVFAEKGKYRDHFWDFYLRSGRTRQVAEGLFHECFGLTYAEVWERLQTYRRTEVKSLTIESKQFLSSVDSPSEIRDATAAEIGRMTGEWSRIAVSDHPREKSQLLNAAGRAFQRALKNTTPSDPRLDAAAGIFIAGLGRDADALPYLESAAKASVARPRAYLEIARIRLAAARASVGATGKLSPVQFARVLEPLSQSYAQSVQQEKYYELLVELWENAAEKPERKDLLTLLDGARFFPRDTEFILRAARLHAAHSYTAEAWALCDAGLALANEERMRASLMRLKNSLGSSTLLRVR